LSDLNVILPPYPQGSSSEFEVKAELRGADVQIMDIDPIPKKRRGFAGRTAMRKLA
jgi:hypothetical protein